MNLKSRVTLALPLVILLAGLVIPVLMGTGDEAPAAAEAPGRHAGRTAEEWVALTERALAHGAYERALSCAKSAELADDGEQYDALIAKVRRARWRAREIDRNAERFLGRPAAELAFDDAGGVTSGVRVAVALPGESLWTLAVAWAAADRGALPAEVDGSSQEVYASWDRLTAANGVRELEVGDKVLVPLSGAEMDAIAEANGRDMATLEDALAAAGAGEPDRARELLDRVSGRFAMASTERKDVLAAIALADAELAAAREEKLVVRANALVESTRTLSRVAAYSELRGALREAARCLEEAEGFSAEERYAQPRAVVAQMLAEVERYRVSPDGSVRTLKPAGVAYTDAAAGAVEWLLGRELAWSGATFPMSGEKTADERAWARYLIEAARMAREHGQDVERLISDRANEAEITLPNPEQYFVAGA